MVGNDRIIKPTPTRVLVFQNHLPRVVSVTGEEKGLVHKHLSST